MVVPLADRFSTAHHGKTVDATMLYFPCFFLLSLSLCLSLCSTNRRMTRTVTKGHDGGRISRFLIKRPVPLGYHGHAWHAIRVIAFDPRTRFPELFGCDRGKSGHSMLPSFLGERFGYYGHHQAEKSRDNWREICGILFCVCVCVTRFHWLWGSWWQWWDVNLV